MSARTPDPAAAGATVGRLGSRRALAMLAAAVLLAVLVALLPGSADAAPGGAKGRKGPAPTEPVPTEPAPEPTPEPTPDSGAAGAPRFSVFLPGTPGDAADLAALAERAGQAPAMVMWYEAWATTPSFPAAAASRVAAAGATPQITWEPWDPAAGLDQPTYALSRIAAGRHDAYLRTWADQIAAYAGPVELRIAHEANGDWYPWAVGVNGSTAGSYIAAWRHIHDVFVARGAANVTWVWSPNISYPGSTPLATFYPGDAYVDQVALDGYNFGTTQSWSSWQTAGELFHASIGELQALTARPIHLGEVASTEVGGDKAAWVTDFFSVLAGTPAIRGFCWFDVSKETDWRIDSSESSQQAFATGLASLG